MTYSDAIIMRLRQLCDQRGITVNKLATLSGITQSTVENLMAGKTKNPKLKTLHKLAIGLDMTVCPLLLFDGLILHGTAKEILSVYAPFCPA